LNGRGALPKSAMVEVARKFLGFTKAKSAKLAGKKIAGLEGVFSRGGRRRGGGERIATRADTCLPSKKRRSWHPKIKGKKSQRKRNRRGKGEESAGPAPENPRKGFAKSAKSQGRGIETRVVAMTRGENVSGRLEGYYFLPTEMGEPTILLPVLERSSLDHSKMVKKQELETPWSSW